jgi:hypothetical protein
VAVAGVKEGGNKSWERVKALDAKVTGKVKAAAVATVDAVTPDSD